MAPLVSVIIPVFNGQAYLAETLACALGQTYPNIEIIVVDDGSTDGSAGIARSFGDRVRLFAQSNAGAGAARNMGFARSRGEYIFFLDADDVIKPGLVDKLVRALETSGADAAYSDWQKLRKDASGRFFAAEIQKQDMTEVDPEPEIALFIGFWAPPAAWIYRRGMVEKVGGHGDLRYIQDAKFHIEAAMQGAKFVHAHGVDAFYREHESGLSKINACGVVRDQLLSADEVRKHWEAAGPLTETRRKALLGVYGIVARTSHGVDRETFKKSFAAMKEIDPKYCPTSSRLMTILCRAFGFSAALALAALWHRTKKGMSLR